MNTKIPILGVISLILFSTIVPIIPGTSETQEPKSADDIPIQNINQDDVKVTCYTYGIPGEPSQEVMMSLGDAEHLLSMIQELQREVAEHPGSQTAQQLYEKIICFTAKHNLVPDHVPLDSIKTYDASPLFLSNHKKKLCIQENTASEFLCTYVSTGSGSSLPIIVLPRFIPIVLTPIPRIFMRWKANDAVTSCGGLRSGTGFIAYGQQNGISLGFWGLGFTFSLPPLLGVYGLAGYALYTSVNAEEIELYPPNIPPQITIINP